MYNFIQFIKSFTTPFQTLRNILDHSLLLCILRPILIITIILGKILHIINSCILDKLNIFIIFFNQYFIKNAGAIAPLPRKRKKSFFYNLMLNEEFCISYGHDMARSIVWLTSRTLKFFSIVSQNLYHERKRKIVLDLY